MHPDKGLPTMPSTCHSVDVDGYMVLRAGAIHADLDCAGSHPHLSDQLCLWKVPRAAHMRCLLWCQPCPETPPSLSKAFSSFIHDASVSRIDDARIHRLHSRQVVGGAQDPGGHVGGFSRHRPHCEAHGLVACSSKPSATTRKLCWSSAVQPHLKTATCPPVN